MLAITVSYFGPTNSSPARFICKFGKARKTFSYDYASANGFRQASEDMLQYLQANTGYYIPDNPKLVQGTLPDLITEVFLIV